MDPVPSLNRIVDEVAQALIEFAEAKHWPRKDYWIYYHKNDEWYGVNFVFVARGFDDADDRSIYVEVWKYLIEYFAENPEILRPVTVMVRSRLKVEQGGLGGIGSAYTEYWTLTPARAN